MVLIADRVVQRIEIADSDLLNVVCLPDTTIISIRDSEKEYMLEMNLESSLLMFDKWKRALACRNRLLREKNKYFLKKNKNGGGV